MTLGEAALAKKEGWRGSDFNKQICMFIFLSCQTLNINLML